MVRKQLLKFITLWGAFICSHTAWAFDVGWNGFGSVYYGQALNQNLLPNGFTNTNVNFTTFSLMGLNVNGKIGDDFSFAGQLVALGNPVGTSDVFSLIAQWADVSYTPIDGLLIKGGRQLYPVLLASEYVRVAYLLPYRQIPSPVFLIAPFSRFDGVSVSYTARLGVGKLTVGLFGGTPIIDINTSTLAAEQQTATLSNLYGGKITLDGDGWRIRAMASSIYGGTTSVAFLPTFSPLGGHVQTYSAGYRFDKYNIVSWGEYLMTRTPDGSAIGGGRYVGNAHSYYLLGGYRFGRFMPRYTFSQGSATDNIPLGSSALIGFNGNITTHTVGLNYQAGDQALVKVEYEYVLVPTAPGSLGYFATGPKSATATSGSAIYCGVDFIF